MGGDMPMAEIINNASKRKIAVFMVVAEGDGCGTITPPMHRFEMQPRTTVTECMT